MNWDRKVLQIGTALIVCAVVLRLLSGGAVSNISQALHSPDLASWLLYLSTGRVVHYTEAMASLPAETETTSPTEATTEPPPTTEATEPVQITETTQPPQPVVFSAADESLVKIKDHCGYELSIEDLMKCPLSWDLTQEGPTVLILHTHGTESYENTEDDASWKNYRSTDNNYNMISIGDRVTQILEEAGIGVIHDRTAHDALAYTGSYDRAREPLQQYLEEYPTIQLVLDLHRDAAKDSAGNQVGYTVTTDLGESAKLMLVVGSNAGGQKHPNWRQNLAMAVKLHAQLEKTCPGICRLLQLRSSRFNQDLSQGALLIEVGSAGNTRQEALVAAEILANCLLDLAVGAVYE